MLRNQKPNPKSPAPPARRKATRDLSQTSTSDAAAYLMERYGRGVELKGSMKPLKGAYYDWNEGKPSVSWNVTQGVHALLHELGHHRLKHDRLELRGKGIHIDEIAEEAEAWLWAEERAYRHDIPFDYADADKWFETYCNRHWKKGIVTIRWRRKK